jgi:hypothetical protein
MFRQSFMDCLSQHSRSFAMDDAHPWQPGHESGIKVMVKLGQGLIYPKPTYT